MKSNAVKTVDPEECCPCNQDPCTEEINPCAATTLGHHQTAGAKNA